MIKCSTINIYNKNRNICFTTNSYGIILFFFLIFILFLLAYVIFKSIFLKNLFNILSVTNYILKSFTHTDFIKKNCKIKLDIEGEYIFSVFFLFCKFIRYLV